MSNSFVLAALLLFAVAAPFSPAETVGHAVVVVMMSVVLIAAVWTVSRCTISTLGHGDILPVTPPARMFAAIEAVTGPLYLAVLIARLVALHASRSRPDA